MWLLHCATKYVVFNRGWVMKFTTFNQGWVIQFCARWKGWVMFSNHHIFKCLACVAGFSNTRKEQLGGSVKKNLHKGNWEGVQKIGIRGRWLGERRELLLSPPPPLSCSPLPTSPQFACSSRACTFTHLLSHLLVWSSPGADDFLPFINPPSNRQNFSSFSSRGSNHFPPFLFPPPNTDFDASFVLEFFLLNLYIAKQSRGSLKQIIGKYG